MKDDVPIVITGHAYGQRATLEIAGDTLTWRARRGLQPYAENISTTVHDVHEAHWVIRRWSFAGIALAGLSAIWMLSETVATGAIGLAVACALIAWRQARPRRRLVLDIHDRRLALEVAEASAASASALAGRITRAQLAGEVPLAPPTLP